MLAFKRSSDSTWARVLDPSAVAEDLKQVCPSIDLSWMEGLNAVTFRSGFKPSTAKLLVALPNGDVSVAGVFYGVEHQIGLGEPLTALNGWFLTNAYPLAGHLGTQHLPATSESKALWIIELADKRHQVALDSIISTPRNVLVDVGFSKTDEHAADEYDRNDTFRSDSVNGLGEPFNWLAVLQYLWSECGLPTATWPSTGITSLAGHPTNVLTNGSVGSDWEWLQVLMFEAGLLICHGPGGFRIRNVAEKVATPAISVSIAGAKIVTRVGGDAQPNDPFDNRSLHLTFPYYRCSSPFAGAEESTNVTVWRAKPSSLSVAANASSAEGYLNYPVCGVQRLLTPSRLHEPTSDTEATLLASRVSTFLYHLFDDAKAGNAHDGVVIAKDKINSILTTTTDFVVSSFTVYVAGFATPSQTGLPRQGSGIWLNTEPPTIFPQKTAKRIHALLLSTICAPFAMLRPVTYPVSASTPWKAGHRTNVLLNSYSLSWFDAPPDSFELGSCAGDELLVSAFNMCGEDIVPGTTVLGLWVDELGAWAIHIPPSSGPKLNSLRGTVLSVDSYDSVSQPTLKVHPVTRLPSTAATVLSTPTTPILVWDKYGSGAKVGDEIWAIYDTATGYVHPTLGAVVWLAYPTGTGLTQIRILDSAEGSFSHTADPNEPVYATDSNYWAAETVPGGLPVWVQLIDTRRLQPATRQWLPKDGKYFAVRSGSHNIPSADAPTNRPLYLLQKQITETYFGRVTTATIPAAQFEDSNPITLGDGHCKFYFVTELGVVHLDTTEIEVHSLWPFPIPVDSRVVVEEWMGLYMITGVQSADILIAKIETDIAGRTGATFPSGTSDLGHLDNTNAWAKVLDDQTIYNRSRSLIKAGSSGGHEIYEIVELINGKWIITSNVQLQSLDGYNTGNLQSVGHDENAEPEWQDDAEC